MAYLKHYGTPRHSGRYPWGSGKDPQRSKSFATKVSELKKQGVSEPKIAEMLGMKNSTELRARIHMESEAKYGSQVAMAARLRAKGYSDVAISKRMDISPNTVKNILLPETQARHKVNEATKKMLQTQADKKGMIDVGMASNLQLGVAKTKMDVSIAELVMAKDYMVTEIQTPQLGTTNKTTVRVLMSPETMKKARSEYEIKDPDKWKGLSKEDQDSKIAYLYASKNSGDIKMITDWSSDGGSTYKSVQPPISVDSKRIMVRYADDTPSGSDMDGVIQLRRGVPDLSLPPNTHYAQVRIAVDDSHYMKGMAIYSDDMPKGVDIIYNSTKKSSGGKIGAMKKMNTAESIGEDSIYIDAAGEQKINEFGASIRQMTYVDKKGKEQQSAINIVGYAGNDDSGVEGSWKTWSKTLSSQFLSKQPPELAKQQLGLAYLDSKDTFDQYMKITQPAVKQRLLDSFADDCDSKAVHLKAAALPRQTSNVIIPITSLKDTECYSPSYRDGEQLALIRYPHAGVFEIPIVTNNTRNKEGISVLGVTAVDAIGITPRTAEQLSGADFDGDTVIAIPYDPRIIKSSSALKSLEGFNPQTAFPGYEGMPRMTAQQKGVEMGKASNLITDMTVKGAPLTEIARAVKHSMVVIDAEKHHLDYKLSYTTNRIADLKARYQGGTASNPRGAATLISRASSEQRVDKRKAPTKEQAQELGLTLVRKGAYSVDAKTGVKVYAPTGDGYYNKKGAFVKTQLKSTKMYEAKDAKTLMSKNPAQIEIIYADYANSMKALGDLARKESANIKMTSQSKSAKEAYKSEVASLNAKLKVALSNAPLERQVHLVGNKQVELRKAANPNMDLKQIKKLKGQVLNDMRERIGASKQRIVITPKEWEAIEAGAISNSLLTQILNNTNLDVVQTYATPRPKTLMSDTKIARAKIYRQQGRTLAQISDMLGVSVSTLSTALKGE